MTAGTCPRARSAMKPASIWTCSGRRALGMPRADDPDAVILLRADSEAAARAKVFIEMGLSREQVITVSRVLGHGLGQTAEAMRPAPATGSAAQ
jgi:class 3 adenylate cyclase